MTDVNFRDSNVPEITRYEHRRKNVGAKATVIHGYIANTDSYFPVTAIDNGDGTYSLKVSSGSSSSLAKSTDAYGVQAISDDGTYKYFFFEDDSANYYVMRKHKTNKTFSYTKGTGGYASVYVNSTSGPSGSPTWADRGATF